MVRSEKGPKYSGRIVTRMAIGTRPKDLRREPSLAAVRAFVESQNRADPGRALEMPRSDNEFCNPMITPTTTRPERGITFPEAPLRTTAAASSNHQVRPSRPKACQPTDPRGLYL